MAEIYLQMRPGNVLTPASERDEELLDKWKVGDVARVTITKVRNPKFHRLAFAFLNYVFDRQDKYDTLEDMLVEFKLRSGHYEEHVSLKGTVMYLPKSISFGSMDEVEFEALYSKWVDLALKYFLPDRGKEEFMDEILGFL